MVAAGGGELFSTAEELMGCLHRLQHEPGYRETLGRRGRLAYETTGRSRGRLSFSRVWSAHARDDGRSRSI